MLELTQNSDNQWFRHACGSLQLIMIIKIEESPANLSTIYLTQFLILVA